MELKTTQVCKQFDHNIACDHISLSLQKGVYGLLGANGAGKTTLMRMLCGILKPDSGTITLDGIPPSDMNYRDALGYLPQNFGYYPDFTALDFMIYLATLKGLDKTYAYRKSNELLTAVGLEEQAKKKIKTFSGGMKQRLGIAQAILNDPKVLILDEPTAGLDPKERIRFRNLISQLGADRIVLLSTHIVSDIEYIAGTILIMKDGAVIHAGALDQILQVIQGKVWTCTVSPKDASILSNLHPVINTRPEGSQTFLRLISSEKPHRTAQTADATLEDLYLYYFSEEDTSKK